MIEKMGQSWPLFPIFRLFNAVLKEFIIKKIANYWIRTSDLGCQKSEVTVLLTESQPLHNELQVNGCNTTLRPPRQHMPLMS